MMKNKRRFYAILIVAMLIIIGIGYVVYPRSRGAEYTVVNQKEETNATSTTWAVTWVLENGSTRQYTDYLKKHSTYSNKISFDTPTLNEIVFNLSWGDDRTTFSGRFGLDRFTLRVVDPDGKVHRASGKSARITGRGFVEISILVPSAGPKSFYMQSNNLSDVENEIRFNSSDYKWVNENFTFYVSMNIGELRPLKRLRDKGNSFVLDVTYSYYVAEVTVASNVTGQSGSMVMTGGPLFSDCPICHGHFRHEPWCPYYDDPFHHDDPFDHDPFGDPFDHDPFN